MTEKFAVTVARTISKKIAKKGNIFFQSLISDTKKTHFPVLYWQYIEMWSHGEKVVNLISKCLKLAAKHRCANITCMAGCSMFSMHEYYLLQKYGLCIAIQKYNHRYQTGLQFQLLFWLVNINWWGHRNRSKSWKWYSDTAYLGG